MSTASTATGFSNQRKIDRCQNGVLWTIWHGGGGAATMAHSTDDGKTWVKTAGNAWNGGFGGTAYTPNVSLFIDVDDYAHVVYKMGADVAGEGTGGFVYYRRGTPNADRTAWTWSAAVAQVGSTAGDYADVVAHREGTGWSVHIILSIVETSTSNRTQARTLRVSPTGTIVLVSATEGNNYGTNVHTFPTIDFNHVGDGKTIAGDTPHLYTAWSAGRTGAGYGMRFRKAVAGPLSSDATEDFAAMPADIVLSDTAYQIIDAGRLKSNGAGRWWHFNSSRFQVDGDFDFTYDLTFAGTTGRDIANMAFWYTPGATPTTTGNGFMFRLDTGDSTVHVSKVTDGSHGGDLGVTSTVNGGNAPFGVVLRTNLKMTGTVLRILTTRLDTNAVFRDMSIDLAAHLDAAHPKKGTFGQKHDGASTTDGHRWDNLALRSIYTWTWNPEREIDNSRAVSGTDRFMLCMFDGTRVVMAGVLAVDASNDDMAIYERDVADTTTTSRILETGGYNRLYKGSVTRDVLGNLYFLGERYTGEFKDLFYQKWTREGAVVGARVQLESGSFHRYVSAMRFDTKVRWVYTSGNNAPYAVKYDQIAFRSRTHQMML